MKTALSILSALFLLSGCAAPKAPNSVYMMEEILAGRMKADDVNRIWDDYRRERAEYEDSAGYKLGVGALLVGVSAVSLAAGSRPSYRGGCRTGYLGGYSSPSKITVGTVPTAGGGAVTTIKAYK